MLTLHDDMPRSAFVRQVAAGLQHPTDAGTWRGKARRRLRELYEDRMDYGLSEQEELERQQLEQLVGKYLDPLDFLAALLGLALGVAILVAIRMAQ